MPRHLPSLILVVLATLANSHVLAEHATHSRNQYVHWIPLYDANGRSIDPTSETAKPYSPQKTCGRCHDYEAISSGHHFNSLSRQAAPGRPGEPWIWADPNTGTQIPLSYRGWEGTFKPEDLGIAPWDFVLKFGRHLPGGGPGQPPEDEEVTEATESAEGEAEAETTEEEDEEKARWELSGWLNVDCLICHDNNRRYSQEARWEQIEGENFAWAPTVGAGMGSVEGEVKRLPDDFDPEAVEENSRYKLPTTTYHGLEINGDKKVLFKVTRQPDSNACYYCHSNRLLGNDAGPDWTHDEDVHLKSGMSCTDCHPNGIDHHLVRGFEGEVNPSGEPVETLSCRGCHLGEVAAGGRLGAPKPMHKGLPPLHLERLACTTCHSGPRVADENFQVQTAMAHGLGLDSHYSADMAPAIVTPVLLQDDGKLYPHRMMWPAFWGQMQGDTITPLNPEAVSGALKSVLRFRTGETLLEALEEDYELSSKDKKALLGEERAKLKEEEWTEEEMAKVDEFLDAKAMETSKERMEIWKEKLPEALKELKEIITEPEAEPVYICAGKAYRLDKDGSPLEFEHPVTEPYAWKFAHDVRPANWSNGVKGCYECHSAGSPIFESQVTAISLIPDETPVTKPMYELSGYDKAKLDAWSQSFQGRAMFKYAGFAAMGIVALILLAYVVTGIQGLYGKLRRS